MGTAARLPRRTLLSALAGAAWLGSTAAEPKPPDGDALLAHIAEAGVVRSYAVPARFHVQLLHPLRASGNVAGTVYYQAPDRSALVITHAPFPIRTLFRGPYQIDLPQTWHAKYRVTSVSPAEQAGRHVFVLQAAPRTPNDIERVTFTLARPDLAPLAATWDYADGSSIAVTNAPAPAPYLSTGETIVVDMRRYGLRASVAFGAYQLDVPPPKGLFPAPAPRASAALRPP